MTRLAAMYPPFVRSSVSDTTSTELGEEIAIRVGQADHQGAAARGIAALVGDRRHGSAVTS